MIEIDLDKICFIITQDHETPCLNTAHSYLRDQTSTHFNYYLVETSTFNQGTSSEGQFFLTSTYLRSSMFVPML